MSELEIYRLAVERNTLKGMMLKQENDISSISYNLCVLMGRDQLITINPADILELVTVLS